ncbi:MAG: chromosomal replication initiator protein DnaA [Planctomycetota bacterium]
MAKLDEALWRDMMGYLRDKHSPICRQWFENLEPQKLAGGLMKVCAESKVQQAYLQSRCREPFTEAAQQVTGQLVAVRFVHGDAKAEPSDVNSTNHAADASQPATTTPPKRSAAKSRAMAKYAPAAVTTARSAPPASLADVEVPSLEESLEEELILDPDHAFAGFIQGPNNELAFALAQAVADQPVKSYNPLFIHGGVGLGKTHLLQAICLRILERDPSYNIVYVSCEKFVNQFIECARGGEYGAFRHHYRHADMLVVDDIQFLAGKEQMQEEFFHTFNELHTQQKQIVLSCDVAPAEIPGLTERLASRFTWGVVAKVSPPGFETRLAIIHAKAKLRGVIIPDDVAEYLARKIDSNARVLEGAVHTCEAHAREFQKPLTVEIARAALGDPGVAPSGRVTLTRIIELVTDFYSVRTAELQSKRRHKSIAEPRQVCMWLARQNTSLSLEDIGGHFGGRDHTTVMHSVSKVESRLENESVFAAQVEQLDQRVKASLL